jgi:hypothetical protein
MGERRGACRALMGNTKVKGKNMDGLDGDGRVKYK